MPADRLNKEAEEVLAIFVDYLNLHHSTDGDYPPITRADFDDEEYQLFPHILLDHAMGNDVRLLMIHADVDDGGGPNVLTAFFNRRIGIDWDLDFVVQHFDTLYEVVYNDGKLRGPDGMVERG